MKKAKKLDESIELILSDWLSCFLLVGYDMDGNEVVCRLVESDKDRDSLLVALNNLSDKLSDAYYGKEGGQVGTWDDDGEEWKSNKK